MVCFASVGTRMSADWLLSFLPPPYNRRFLTLVHGFCPVSSLSLQSEIEMLKLQLDLLHDIRDHSTRYKEIRSEVGNNT